MSNKFNPTKAKLLGYSSTAMGILAIIMGLVLYFARPDYENIFTVLIILIAIGVIDILLGIVFLYTAKLAARHFQAPPSAGEPHTNP